jgi:hypothetical protein
MLVGLHTWSHDRFNQINNMLPIAEKYDFNLLLPEFRGNNLKTNPNRTKACGSDYAKQDIKDAIDYIKDEAKITRIRLKPFSKQEVRGYTYTFRIYNISFYKSKEDAELWKANQLGREFEDYIDSTTGLVVDLKDSLNKNWYKIGKDKYDLRTLTTDKNRM